MCYLVSVTTAKCAEGHPVKAVVCWRQCATQAQKCADGEKEWNSQCYAPTKGNPVELISKVTRTAPAEECRACRLDDSGCAEIVERRRMQQQYLDQAVQEQRSLLQFQEHLERGADRPWRDQMLRQTADQLSQAAITIAIRQYEIPQSTELLKQRKAKFEKELPGTVLDAAIEVFHKPGNPVFYYYGHQEAGDRERRKDAPEHFPPASQMPEERYPHRIVPRDAWWQRSSR